MNNRYLLSRSRFIEAAPEAIFEVLATPALHSVIDGSGTVKGAQPSGPGRLALGAKFGMEMNVRVDYKILNSVCEFEEGRRIAWRHFYGHVWRYLLEPASGTRGRSAVNSSCGWRDTCAATPQAWKRPWPSSTLTFRLRAAIPAPRKLPDAGDADHGHDGKGSWGVPVRPAAFGNVDGIGSYGKTEGGNYDGPQDTRRRSRRRPARRDP